MPQDPGRDHNQENTSKRRQPANDANSKEPGAFLHAIMAKGATEDWRKVLKDATGEDLSTRATADDFKPLMAWPEIQNQGRQIGWDESTSPMSKETP